jgi:hypothetical protein
MLEKLRQNPDVVALAVLVLWLLSGCGSAYCA